jgi:hypothetical protein
VRSSKPVTFRPRCLENVTQNNAAMPVTGCHFPVFIKNTKRLYNENMQLYCARLS